MILATDWMLGRKEERPWPGTIERMERWRYRVSFSSLFLIKLSDLVPVLAHLSLTLQLDLTVLLPRINVLQMMHLPPIPLRAVFLLIRITA